MKIKLLLTSIALVACLGVHAQGTEQMVFQNDFKESSGGLGNITAMFMTDGWWKDANGDDAAVIRIKVIDMSVSQMKKLRVKGSLNLGLNKKEFLEKEHQWIIAVSAGSNMFLEMEHADYGTSSRLNLDGPLKPNTIYDVTLINNKTTTIVVRSIPAGADVYLDGDNKGKTPCEIPGQRYGHHNLKLLYGGGSLVQDIEVEEGHTVFDKFDFRERAKIKITSDPDGADIYVDNIKIGKAPILDYNVILGAHTFRAVLNEQQTDEQSINITKFTTTVDLHPVKKSNVQINTKYGGRPVAATLVVDNEKNYTNSETYNLTLPYGQHNFRVSYAGRTKEKNLKLNKPETGYTFKLSAKNDFQWPWQREFDARVAGFSAGYVSKQIVSKNGSTRLKYDPAFYRESKWLHGMQLGFHFQPAFSWGGGLYFGLFYELYLGHSNEYAGETIDDEYSYFTEHSLNIPLHLYYRITLTRNFCVAIHGGMGMDIGLYAFYAGSVLGATDDSSKELISDYYGEDNYGPKRVNFTADLALSINYKWIGLNAFYSQGLTNHDSIVEWEDGGGSTHINKFGLSLSFLF